MKFGDYFYKALNKLFIRKFKKVNLNFKDTITAKIYGYDGRWICFVIICRHTVLITSFIML